MTTYTTTRDEGTGTEQVSAINSMTAGGHVAAVESAAAKMDAAWRVFVAVDVPERSERKEAFQVWYDRVIRWHAEVKIWLDMLMAGARLIPADEIVSAESARTASLVVQCKKVIQRCIGVATACGQLTERMAAK